MLYEERVREIDKNYSKIKLFDKDTLFLNIYYFWCFANYVLMYYIQHPRAITRLEQNLRKKWVNDLPDINLFIELVKKKRKIF